MALKILDANVLIYALNETDPSHAEARTWLEATLRGSDTVGIPMLAIAAALRAASHASLDHVAERLVDAIETIDALVAHPHVSVLHTDGRHWAELKRVLQESGVTGRMITDAQFAALALQHSGILCSTDKHFNRFPRLRWLNPLVRDDQ